MINCSIFENFDTNIYQHKITKLSLDGVNLVIRINVFKMNRFQFVFRLMIIKCDKHFMIITLLNICYTPFNDKLWYI